METTEGSGVLDYYVADVVAQSDYFPFGMLMPNTNIDPSDGSTIAADNDYRYGYQGSEMDNEVKGQNNSYTTHFRQFDPRVGRWLSIDPKAVAWESPYVSMRNNPIIYNDTKGDFIPIVIAGYVIGEAAVAWIMVGSVVLTGAVSYEISRIQSESYSKPWYTDRPAAYYPPPPGGGRGMAPGGGDGPKLAKWIVATGLAAHVVKKLYEGQNPPPPENYDPEGEQPPVSIVGKDGRLESFIDINMSNMHERPDGRVDVTVRADAIITIEEGDNLTNLAETHNVTIEQLVEWNDIEDPSLIIAGRYLKVGEASETQTFDKEDESVIIESNSDED